MSAKQTGLVWELDLPHNEAWVLMAMADHADHDGNNVYPGVPLLAWKTGYTTRQVRRILAILQRKGLIVVEKPGGGRRTTRYRMELSQAARKDLERRGKSPTKSIPDRSEGREDNMSPLEIAPSNARMSAQGGQNVSGARTTLCHPNRQGREGFKPSEPPPSGLPRPSALHPIASVYATREGGRDGLSIEENNGEGREQDHQLVRQMLGLCAAWAANECLPKVRVALFNRQAERLASGRDVEAWTHLQNGAVVPPADRLRILGLGLRNFGDGTSHTLRGGVMYAVAKHYRIPPPVAGTEHAALVARATAEEGPRLTQARARPAATPTVLASVLRGRTARAVPEEDPVEGWERCHAEESAILREQIARELAADVGQRQISERILRSMGQAQYRHRVLQHLRIASNGAPTALPAAETSRSSRRPG
jgi:hypothetical protein